MRNNSSKQNKTKKYNIENDDILECLSLWKTEGDGITEYSSVEGGTHPGI